MGGQYGRTLLYGWTIRRNFTEWLDNTVELSKKGGQYGGTFQKKVDNTPYGGTLLNGRKIRRNFIKFKWADNTAELSKMGGQYGGPLLNGWKIRGNFTKWVKNTAELY